MASPALRYTMPNPRLSQGEHHSHPQLRKVDIVCFSHLRWDFVYQRPQHLLNRAAQGQRVYFFEEPVMDAQNPWLELSTQTSGVRRAVPHVPAMLSIAEVQGVLRNLLDEMITAEQIAQPVAWYYTPLALKFSRHLDASLTVYDCMDELSAFKDASSELPALEKELFTRSDLVFTGGDSLYQAKRRQHDDVHSFPSSIDRAHFAAASEGKLQDPLDQARLPHPRLGYFGVIDERLDAPLLEEVARAHREWQLVMVGPVVKIDARTLPDLPNIHWLGQRSYDQLPGYLAHWDVAIMPFALNEATRFISPTKTLEFLAAMKPVVSTAITDVVAPYGQCGLVKIANSAREFVLAVEATLTEPQPSGWRSAVAQHLASTSWDATWEAMAGLLDKALSMRPELASAR